MSPTTDSTGTLPSPFLPYPPASQIPQGFGEHFSPLCVWVGGVKSKFLCVDLDVLELIL